MSKARPIYAVKACKNGLRHGFLDVDLHVCEDRPEFEDKRWCYALVEKAERQYPSAWSFEVACCGPAL